MKKTIFVTAIAAVISSLVTVFAVVNLTKNEKETVILPASNETAVRYAAFSDDGEPVNFSVAAEKTVNSVVHVTTVIQQDNSAQSSGDPFFDFFYGYRNRGRGPAMSSGSGVIISPDGYIVTNNHVIDNASEVRIAFNDKRTAIAKVVGTDKNTDLALLKVDEKNLPALTFGNSDNLRLGEWVLAVGNPFNMSTTVTAGIVSAKARDINIIYSEFRIESFIQTDAAVNPGNSGGALVNLRGELVGINTAIASRSGQYEGYAFAVPTSIVKKVVEDLMQFGKVQRALLGIRYQEVTSDLAKEYGLKEIKGVYIARVEENSAAKDAGIQAGDVLLKINDVDVTGSAIVQEQVAQRRPGDKMNLTVNRDGKMKQFTVVLRNTSGNTSASETANEELAVLGATFKEVAPEVRRKLGIFGGLQIDKLSNGKLKQNGIKEGFIITQINQRPVRSEEDLKNTIKSIKSGGIFIGGIYPDGKEAYYAFGM